MGSALILAFLICLVVIVPLLVIKLLFQLALGILFLPFKLLGLLFRLVFGVFGLATRVVFSGVGLLFGLFALFFALLLAPLLPLLLVVGFVWLLTRLFRSPSPLPVRQTL